MTQPAHSTPDIALEVLGRLVRLAENRGMSGLAGALLTLNEFVAEDLSDIEAKLARTPTRSDLVGEAARHLLDLEGKRIRPMCVALAARAGHGFDARGVALAAAVELVHSATLLHDDVIDVGEERRGQPTSRVLFGNAASVFAGDWLLIHALRLVRKAEVDGLLDRLLATIDEMIEAESVQLERRGRLDVDRKAYFHIIEGKTASLFRWAMVAGGRSGGLSWGQCEDLARYGNHLGMAFQIVDDALDFAESGTGKGPLADLEEGKMTYPLIVAMERDATLRPIIETALHAGTASNPDVSEAVRECLRRTEAIEASLELAQRHADDARAALGSIDASEAKQGLELVAEVAVRRPT